MDITLLHPRRSPAYSPNLHRWLRLQQSQYILNREIRDRVYRVHANSLLCRRYNFAPGELVIGLPFENEPFADDFSGAQLMHVLTMGSQAVRMCYPGGMGGLERIDDFWEQYHCHRSMRDRPGAHRAFHRRCQPLRVRRQHPDVPVVRCQAPQARRTGGGGNRNLEGRLTMDRATAVRKVRTCLRLAASSNPHEAAAALRQAKALMAQFGIGHAEAMNVDEADAPTRARGAEVPTSILMLATICCRGFGARNVQVQMHGRTVFRFFGIDGVATITAYAFTVLRRQMDADRLKHISRIRKRVNREARGETFALAWVFAIKDLFPAVTLNEAHTALLGEAIRLRFPDVEQGTGGRDLTHGRKVGSKLAESDMLAGYHKGKAARLHSGVTGSGAPAAALDQLALEFHA